MESEAELARSTEFQTADSNIGDIYAPCEILARNQ